MRELTAQVGIPECAYYAKPGTKAREFVAWPNATNSRAFVPGLTVCKTLKSQHGRAVSSSRAAALLPMQLCPRLVMLYLDQILQQYLESERRAAVRDSIRLPRTAPVALALAPCPSRPPVDMVCVKRLGVDRRLSGGRRLPAYMTSLSHS